MMKWLLSQTNFYVIFPTFVRYTTKFRGTLATVPISTHPSVHELLQFSGIIKIDAVIIFNDDETG
jgi:hypothetical protein